MTDKSVEESSTKDHPERLLVNLYGPDGVHSDVGQHVPGRYEREYVESLIAAGAARVMSDDEAAALTARPAVDTTVNTGMRS